MNATKPQSLGGRFGKANEKAMGLREVRIDANGSDLGRMIGDWFVRVLIAQYVAVAIVYAWQGAWYKCLYFLSAAGISVAVLGMR